MWYNPLMTLLLTSPAHSLVSHNIMLLHVRGKKSGKLYNVPVNYIQDGDTLYTVSYRDRIWWRNLRGGVSISVLLRGKNKPAHGTVLEEPSEVRRALIEIFNLNPVYAAMFKVGGSTYGDYDSHALEKAVKQVVIVKTQLGVERFTTQTHRVVG